jgi:hypothetical protein
MNISVTKHAIKRYRERLFDYTTSSETIENLLKEIARHGNVIDVRPSSLGNCTEIEYTGISIVVINNSAEYVIITCLGNGSYRKWVKNQDKRSHIGGRVLYPRDKVWEQS